MEKASSQENSHRAIRPQSNRDTRSKEDKIKLHSFIRRHLGEDAAPKVGKVILGALKHLEKQGLPSSKYKKAIETLIKSVKERQSFKFTIPECILYLEIARRGLPLKHHWRVTHNYEYDIFIPVHNEIMGLAVECDIEFWHSRSRHKDKTRDIISSDAGILTLRYKDRDIYHCIKDVGDAVEKAYNILQDTKTIAFRRLVKLMWRENGDKTVSLRGKCVL